MAENGNTDGDPNRFTGVDFVRFFAATGIVWFHLGSPGSDLAYAGLPILLVLSIALPVIHAGGRSLVDEVSRRGKRLILPWLFWSTFYFSWSATRSIYRHIEFSRVLEPNWLLIG